MGCHYGCLPCPVLSSGGNLARHSNDFQDNCNYRLFVISHYKNQFSWLCNINDWQKQHRLHIVGRFVWLIYLPHRRGVHSTNFLAAVTCDSQSNSKSYLQKHNYVQNYYLTCPLSAAAGVRTPFNNKSINGLTLIPMLAPWTMLSGM